MIASDVADRAARSDRIWAHIVPLLEPRVAGARIMLFESRPTEPDTTTWIDWCRTHLAQVHLPVVDGVELRAEPGDIDPATLDVVIVPGLGFTRDGRRLGQGGGHYDRFLPRLSATAVTIGVCFAEQLLDDVPTDPHDVPVDQVVTD